MKLAFNGEAHYTVFDNGFEIYRKRSKSGKEVDYATYKRIVRSYCKLLASRLHKEGMVDLPSGLGSIMAAILTRRPQYRGSKFIGYGGYDWEKKQYDGKLKTFGLVFLPGRQKKDANLRCYGYVANRELFRQMKEAFVNEKCSWSPMEFKDEMI